MAERTPKSLFAPVLHSSNLTYTLLQSTDIKFIRDLFNSTMDSEAEDKFTISSVRRLCINTAPRPSELHGERSKDAAIYVVRLNGEAGERIGEINLTRRASHFPLDIGFAFLPQYCGKGYGTEAATRIMRYWKDEFGLNNICGIVSEHNMASRRLLIKIGLEENGWVVSSGKDALIYSLPGAAKQEGRELSVWGEEPIEQESIILN